jgi:hypothetical protein
MTGFRSIASLQPAEEGYIPSHALWVRGGRMHVDGNFPLREVCGGSCNVRILRDANGRLLIDTHGHTEGFYTGPSSNLAHGLTIDEMLAPPAPYAGGKRIFDMGRYDEAYIAASEVWVFEGKRMWLNGYTVVSDKLSEETPVRIVRDSSGAFDVDLHYCTSVEWADEQPTREFMFPMQVHRRVR